MMFYFSVKLFTLRYVKMQGTGVLHGLAVQLANHKDREPPHAPAEAAARGERWERQTDFILQAHFAEGPN